jgi:hypothetical protein
LLNALSHIFGDRKQIACPTPNYFYIYGIKAPSRCLQVIELVLIFLPGEKRVKIYKNLTNITLCCTLISSACFSTVSIAGNTSVIPPSPNGIPFPADYPDWRVISVSHRTDHHSMRAILGNDIAIEAARENRINPWPDGAALAKVVWKEGPEENWAPAIAPKKFIHVEFMFKDTKKWAATGGWGYARWVGEDLVPYGKDASFTQECVACHTPVKDRDWVYTTPAFMPVIPKHAN